MAKLRMKKIELIALLTDSKKIIELLQRRGVVEISRNDDEELDSTNVTAVVGEFEKFRSTVSNALGILDRYVPEKTAVIDMFGGKTEVEKHDFGRGAIQFEKIMTVANEIIRSSNEISEAEKSISQMNIRCDILKQWINLDVPMNFKGTATTTTFIGSV
ncbi:MAG: V-type ATP synthase subunit I, partial [Ruminococcus sp.]|nr:V-type ATP synthase subunit I [Ruminococcus sp.]